MHLEDDKAVAQLVNALEDESPKVRVGAVFALGHYEAPESAPALIEHLSSDPDEHVRQQCATVLRWMKDQKTADALLSALKDESHGVKSAAASSLAYLGDQRAIEPLMTMIYDPDWHVRRAACEALVDLKLADKRLVTAINRLRGAPEAKEYEQGLAAAHFFMQMFFTSDFTESIEELDGRPVDENKREGLQEIVNATRHQMKDEPFPEPPVRPLKKLEERARQLLHEQE
jgi:HEAT repeat protein